MKGAIIGFGVIAEGHLFAYYKIDEKKIWNIKQRLKLMDSISGWWIFQR